MHGSAKDMSYPSDGDCFIPEGWERKRQFLRTYYVLDGMTWSSLQCYIGFIVPIFQTENMTQQGCVLCAGSHGGGRDGI